MEIKHFVKNPAQFDYLNWMQLVREELDAKSDRATITLMISIFDLQLQRLLESFMIECKETNKLFEGNGVLSTFNNKISLCYSLGIISEHEFRTLNILRRIRNRFAHEIKIKKFEDDKNSIDLANNLSIPFGMYVPDTLAIVNGEVQPFPIDTFNNANIHDKILMAFYYLTFYLETRFVYLEKRVAFEAPTQWQVIEHLQEMYRKYEGELLSKLEKDKEQLQNQQQSEERDQLLDEIENLIADIAQGAFGLMANDLTVPCSEYERISFSILSAIKKSYGVE